MRGSNDSRFIHLPIDSHFHGNDEKKNLQTLCNLDICVNPKLKLSYIKSIGSTSIDHRTFFANLRAEIV